MPPRMVPPVTPLPLKMVKEFSTWLPSMPALPLPPEPITVPLLVMFPRKVGGSR